MVSRNPYLEPIDDDIFDRPNPIDDSLKSSQSRRYLKTLSYIKDDKDTN
mgnify:CR=1 FL=1